MAKIQEYPLDQTGAQIQQAIDDALETLPHQIGLKANTADVLTKYNVEAYVPTAPYHPATKQYADNLRPTFSVGQTITGQPGTNASVVNVGTDREAIMDFTIPRGDPGTPAGFGTPSASVTTLEPGSDATVSISASGADTAKVFDFTFGIPRGVQGIQGAQGYYVGSIARTSGDGSAGTNDTYTMYLNDAGETPIGNFTVHNGTDGTGAGTVTSVAVENVADGSLTITGSPITANGTISIRHSNDINAQTTQAIYPITFDRSGHITSCGTAFDASTKENTSNKVTSISSSSTNTQYPSALAVYNLFNSIINGDNVNY